MLRKLAKVLAWAGLVVLALIVVVLVRWTRTFEAPYPEIHASKDPAVIARGRYLVNGPAHCVGCHTDDAQKPAVAEGKEVPLSGGHVFKLPFGTIVTPNLTPDTETGIGRRTDAELARLIRYGVRHDGRAALPFMEYRLMSDEDIAAVISYLRAQQPVRKAQPDPEFTLVGKALMAFLIKPVGPSSEPPKVTPVEEASIERGAYLANNVAACASCHTKRNMLDGSYAGAKFSGGFEMAVKDDPNTVVVSPNLTPDHQTGRITAWSEEQFVGRFGVGVGVNGTHMPWKQFQKMSDTDVRAIYRYLRSLEPVSNATGPSVQKREGAT